MRNSRAFEVADGSHKDVYYCDTAEEARELFALDYFTDLSMAEINKRIKPRLKITEVTE